MEEVDEGSTVGSGLMEREKSCMIMRRRGPGGEMGNSAGIRDKEQEQEVLLFEKYKYELNQGNQKLHETYKKTEQEYDI